MGQRPRGLQECQPLPVPQLRARPQWLELPDLAEHHEMVQGQEDGSTGDGDAKHVIQCLTNTIDTLSSSSEAATWPSSVTSWTAATEFEVSFGITGAMLLIGSNKLHGEFWCGPCCFPIYIQKQESQGLADTKQQPPLSPTDQQSCACRAHPHS